MSLNFSSPLFLLGLFGLTFPVLIHLFTRRQQKQIRFSAVYLLTKSQKRSIKKSRPNKLFLLLARCLIIALLSMALAKPLFSTRTTESLLPTSPASIVFILDDSYSMGTRSKEKTLFNYALEYLYKGLKQVPEDTEFSIVLASSPARIEQDWTSDKSNFINKLEDQEVSYRTTHIGDAVKKAINLLESGKHKKKKILLLTDLDKNGWEKETFPKITTPYSFQLLNFAGLQSEKNKVMIENIQISQEFLTRSRLLRVKTKVKNFSKTVSRSPLSLFLEGKLVKEEFLEVPTGQTLMQEFSYPLVKNQPLNGKLQISEDALPVDNNRYFSFHPSQNIQVLVVDGDPETISHQSESFYLERALNPFSVSLSHIDPTVSTLSELILRNLSDFSVVILANVRELPPGYELELEKFVLNGGALLLGMGDQVDPKYFNEHLGNLLPIQLDSLQEFKTEALHLMLKNNNHPVMRVFSPKAINEMREINFHAMYTLQSREEKTFKVGAWFSNQHPAVIESEEGKGIVILFLSSLDRDWNDFPIQPTYLPWIQRWTQYATRGLENISQKDLLIGEPFRKNTTTTKWIVRAPNGKLQRFKNDVFSKTFQPGVYSLFSIPSADTEEQKVLKKLPLGAEPVGSFTVNIDTHESEPEKITRKEIESLLQGFKLEFLEPQSQTNKHKESEAIPLATPFLLMVAAMFLIEGWVIRNE